MLCTTGSFTLPKDSWRPYRNKRHFLTSKGSQLVSQHSLDETCHYCWKTLDTAFTAIDDAVQHIFDETLGQGGRILGNILLAVLAREFALIGALSACHHHLLSRNP